jgi:glycerol kinase
MVANGWLCRFLAGITATPVERPATLEATALGAAFLAGMAVGVWDGIAGLATLDRAITRFEPALPAAERTALLDGWHTALARARR